MPASVSRAIIQGGVGLVGSTSRTMRATNSDAPTRPRIGARSSTAIGNPRAGRRPRRPSRSRRVAEGRAGGVRVLARDAAHRQRVAAVGRDVDVDRDVVEAEQRDRVGADGRVDAEFDEAQDAGVLVAEAQLLRRGDHAVRDVAVGLARRDRERAGQDRARAASRRPCRRRRSCGRRRRCRARRRSRGSPRRRRTWHQRIVLPLDCGSSTNSSDLADDDRTLQLEAEDVLLFEPDAHERLEDVFGRGFRRHIDVLTQPRERDAHQTTIPNCSLKRTSPSAMSRMSCTSLRNISVRSMPIPNAKPEYSSGSMPGRAQHVRVDHAAAAPLDPARAALEGRVPEVELGATAR